MKKTIDILPRLRTIIVKQLGVDETKVIEEASFKEDLHADSFDVLDLVMAIEEEFNIEILDEDFEKFRL